MRLHPHDRAAARCSQSKTIKAVQPHHVGLSTCRALAFECSRARWIDRLSSTRALLAWASGALLLVAIMWIPMSNFSCLATVWPVDSVARQRLEGGQQAAAAVATANLRSLAARGCKGDVLPALDMSKRPVCAVVVTVERAKRRSGWQPPAYPPITIMSLLRTFFKNGDDGSDHGAGGCAADLGDGVDGLQLRKVFVQDVSDKPSDEWSAFLDQVHASSSAVTVRRLDAVSGAGNLTLARSSALQNDAIKAALQRETSHYLVALQACVDWARAVRRPDTLIMALQGDAMLLSDDVRTSLSRLVQAMDDKALHHTGRNGCALRAGQVDPGDCAIEASKPPLPWMLRLFHPPHLLGISSEWILVSDAAVLAVVAALTFALVVVIEVTHIVYRLRWLFLSRAFKCTVRGQSEAAGALDRWSIGPAWLRAAHRRAGTRGAVAAVLVRACVVGGIWALWASLALGLLGWAVGRASLLWLGSRITGPQLGPDEYPLVGNVVNLYPLETAAGIIRDVGALLQDQASLLASTEIDVLVPLVIRRAGGTWSSTWMPLAHHLGIVSSLPGEPTHDRDEWLRDHLFYEHAVDEMAATAVGMH